MNHLEIFKALSNKTRLDILNWLKDPENHFEGPLNSDFEETGICVGQIQSKSGLTQSTISEYLAVLQRAGLVTSVRKGQWTYYKRNDEMIKNLGELINTL